MATWFSATRSSSSRGRRGGALSLAAVIALPAAVIALLAAAGPCYADTIALPAPQADQLGGSELFQALGASRDQLPGYLAPGPLSNDELVSVEVSGDGGVRRVTDEQRIRITGTGDYFVREAGPARAVAAADGDAPVLNLGDVVWQGFAAGSRQLAARIDLDPEIEQAHLPLRVGLSFTARGFSTPLGAAGQLPGSGVVTLTLDNTTGQRVLLPTGADAAARQLAPALDRQLAAASHGDRLPTTRTGIPAQLQLTGAGARQAVQLMPLRLTGVLSVRYDDQPAAAISAVRIDSLLQARSQVRLAVRRPGTLTLQLTATPALDPDALTPPRRASSWAAWAASDPPIAERRAALDALVQAAATGSRASAYSPYLGSQLEPRGSTVFRYTLVTTRSSGPAPPGLTPRPVPISLAVLGALALLGSGVLLWRRS